MLPRGRPHVTGVAEAVQHDDCRPLTADAGVDGRAVGRDLLRANAGWEGLRHQETHGYQGRSLSYTITHFSAEVTSSHLT
jgi:hypothetical protein